MKLEIRFQDVLDEGSLVIFEYLFEERDLSRYVEVIKREVGIRYTDGKTKIFTG